MGLLGQFLKKLLIFQQAAVRALKKVLIFGEMDFLALRLKTFLYLKRELAKPKNKKIQEMELINFFYISIGNLQSLKKNKKKQEMELLNFFPYFRRELAKPGKQKFLIFQEIKFSSPKIK